MTARLNWGDLSPELQKKLKQERGAKAPRTRKFTKEHERRYAHRVMAVLTNLTQAERTRVLRQALKVNDV